MQIRSLGQTAASLNCRQATVVCTVHRSGQKVVFCFRNTTFSKSVWQRLHKGLHKCDVMGNAPSNQMRLADDTELILRSPSLLLSSGPLLDLLPLRRCSWRIVRVPGFPLQCKFILAHRPVGTTRPEGERRRSEIGCGRRRRNVMIRLERHFRRQRGRA